MRFGTLGMAYPASVPVPPIKFVNGMGVGIVPVHRVACTGHVMFPTVLGMLDSGSVQGMVVLDVVIISSCHHVVLLAFVLGHVQPAFGLQSVLPPHQPFHGHFGVVDAASPPQRGFGRNGVRGRQCIRRYRLQAEAAVICSNGSKGARDWNSCMKDRHPSFSSRTSERQ